MEAKELIRNQMRRRRLELTVDEIKSTSKAIAERLQTAIDWSKISSVHSYQAIAKNRELETYTFLGWLKANHPSIEIYLQDTTGNFPEEQFDVVLTPGLAFDTQRHRLGYGKGMYDSWLASQEKATIMGLAYSWSVVEKLPVEDHDIAMNYIISEKELYN